MKNVFYILFAAALAFGAVACSTDQAPDATAEPAASSTSSAPGAPAANVVKPAAPKPAVPRTFEVPEGTELTVALISPISTATNKAGDDFTASLAEPIIVGGQTIAAKGALVNGRIVDAEGSGRVSGRASIRLVLTSI